VFTAVLLNIQIFWNMTPCELIVTRIEGLFDPEDEGTDVFRNVDIFATRQSVTFQTT
jgi:hypothetical protein